jgi:hypothetical protein
MNFWQKNSFLCFLSSPICRISPWDLFLFPCHKNNLKGRHFGTFYNIQMSVIDELKGIPVEAFQHCCELWKQFLGRCVAAQGNYLEGDNLVL